MVGVLLYYRGLKTTPVLVASILELIFPVLAVLIDVYLYQTVLQPTQYVAAAIMLYCVYMTNRVGLQHQHH
jgi:drug/metabolite transporter (DMT)-like permease